MCSGALRHRRTAGLGLLSQSMLPVQAHEPRNAYANRKHPQETSGQKNHPGSRSERPRIQSHSEGGRRNGAFDFLEGEPRLRANRPRESNQHHPTFVYLSGHTCTDKTLSIDLEVGSRCRDLPGAGCVHTV